MKQSFLFICIIVVILILYVFSHGYTVDHDKDCLKSWAKSNEYTISNIEYCTLEKGPYFFTGKFSRVYRTKVDNECYYFCFWLGNDNFAHEKYKY
jgi:hypothetical protein